MFAQAVFPGSELVCNAAHATGTGWLNRTPEHRAVQMLTHLLLVEYCGVKPVGAIRYNPHGFRHIMVSCGQQRMRFGLVETEDMERCWALGQKGSMMPSTSDDYCGVSERHAKGHDGGTAAR